MVDEHRKLRFSDVAAAIEATPKALRKMLDHPQLVMFGPDSEETDGKWQDFTLLQVASFAISRRLIDFGGSVSVSSGRATSVLCDLYLSLFNLKHVHEEITGKKGVQLGTFLDHISGSHLVLTNDEDGVQAQHEVLTSVALKQRYPSWSLDRAVLIVPIGAVVSRAMARALIGPRIDSSGNERSALIPFRKVQLPIGRVYDAEERPVKKLAAKKRAAVTPKRAKR